MISWCGAQPSEHPAGFTLTELLIATLIASLVAAAAVQLATPLQALFQSRLEGADVQQRLRAGIEPLFRDLIGAGAGVLVGQPGPLIRLAPAVLPYRVGTRDPDPPQGHFFRRSVLTILSVPFTAAQGPLARATIASFDNLVLAPYPACLIPDLSCGFREGSRAGIYDSEGGFDVFTVSAVDKTLPSLQHTDDGLSGRYAAGSIVAELLVHTYWLKADAATGSFQLMQYDGYKSDQPLVDNVVSLAFEYFGDPTPPRSVADAGGSLVATYGPPPLEPSVSTDANWPPGENCAFGIDPSTGTVRSRLAELGPPGSALVPLDAALLIDGPWCPDAAAANRFDADLLRVRAVRVTLRVQVAPSVLRGPAGVLFSRGGSSRAAERFVPDQEIRFDVTPRNLGVRQ